MNRVIAIIVLATFFPMQIYAAGFDGFSTDTQYERFFPRGPEAPAAPSYRKGSDKLLEEPPKGAVAETAGFNWWLWGGLAVLVGGVVAALAGGSKGGGGAPPATTGSGTVTW